MKVKSAAAVIYQNVLEVFKHLSVTEKEEIFESCFNHACLSHNKKNKQLSLSRFHIMLRSKSFFLILRQLLELLKKKKRWLYRKTTKNVKSPNLLKILDYVYFCYTTVMASVFKKKKKSIKESKSQPLWKWSGCISMNDWTVSVNKCILKHYWHSTSKHN